MINLRLINKSELARQLGVSIVYMHYILSGVKKSRRLIQRVADHLGMSIEEIHAQLGTKTRQADAPPQHSVRANKSRPDRRSPAKNVPHKKH